MATTAWPTRIAHGLIGIGCGLVLLRLTADRTAIWTVAVFPFALAVLTGVAKSGTA